MASCRDSPVEIHPLLGELPVAMVRILKGFILDDLHPFSAVALFMAVLADHVQLSDFVLQNTQGQRGQSAPRPPSETAPPPRPRQWFGKQRQSALSASERRQTHGPGVIFPSERGGESVVSRVEIRRVPVNSFHLLGDACRGG